MAVREVTGQFEATTELADQWMWLESTRKLQQLVYGYPIEMLIQGARVKGNYTELTARYLEWNTFAIYNELAELAYEFSWKPWASDKPFVNGDRIMQECIDVLHFIGNILHTGAGHALGHKDLPGSCPYSFFGSFIFLFNHIV